MTSQESGLCRLAAFCSSTRPRSTSYVEPSVSTHIAPCAACCALAACAQPDLILYCHSLSCTAIPRTAHLTIFCTATESPSRATEAFDLTPQLNVHRRPYPQSPLRAGAVHDVSTLLVRIGERRHVRERRRQGQSEPHAAAEGEPGDGGCALTREQPQANLAPCRSRGVHFVACAKQWALL